ncbi:hypothetical protein [Arcobacter sp. F2176]|uniref:hypothetical protein n=1 Tax=Arcobacter sp. F2176 TaxID=2044511 RepID=UPI00100C2C2A|nr:hypothetical protein [Arcobacter sp. F2176]RXJ82164.1 hypothetical protein CRU95_04565 [Arcobacter sp. F2176]
MNREEILKEFGRIENLEQLKKTYKTLAKKLHPDVGGTDEEFKILNSVYNELLEKDIFFSQEFNLELEKIVTQILRFENIEINIIGSWIWVSGDTKDIKDELKKLNFKWARVKKMWYYGERKKGYGKEMDLEDIKNKYGCTTMQGKRTERKPINSNKSLKAS